MKTVLLDNGHGNNTPGKRSPIWSDGIQLFEWEFNREIVQLIANELENLGIDYRIIVPEVTDIPMTERCKRINKICSEEGVSNCFLISVHGNAGGGTGWQCHIYTDKTKSKDIAITMTESAKDMFSKDWKIRQPLPNQLYWIDNFQILRDSNCPAVLTENFFMDTEKDCRFMLSDDGKKQIIDMHVNAIKKIVDYQEKLVVENSQEVEDNENNDDGRSVGDIKRKTCFFGCNWWS